MVNIFSLAEVLLFSLKNFFFKQPTDLVYVYKVLGLCTLQLFAYWRIIFSENGDDTRNLNNGGHLVEVVVFPATFSRYRLSFHTWFSESDETIVNRHK